MPLIKRHTRVLLLYPRFAGCCCFGLLLPATRSTAGLCLALLLIAMFPANINAARKHIQLRGKRPTPLWLRLPMQLVYIGLAVIAAL